MAMFQKQFCVLQAHCASAAAQSDSNHRLRQWSHRSRRESPGVFEEVVGCVSVGVGLSFIQTRMMKITMKHSHVTLALLATVLTLSATVASAQLSCAEVNAQLKAAQASGQLGALTGEDSGSAYLAAHFQPTETRSEVKGEVKEARANGTLNVLDGTDSGSFYLSRHQTLDMPRAEVKAELATAEKNGTLDQLYGEDSGSFELVANRYQAGSHSAVALK